MARYIIKRILWMIPIILGVLLVVFTLSHFTPGDPVETLLGSNYTPEAYAEKAHELGLDKPFIVQYFNYVWGIITRFDFGTSYIYGHAVGPEMAARFPITLKLGVFGLALAVAMGIPFGLLSATRQYSVLDNSVTVFAMFFAAMPNFWLGLMLILIFGLFLGWFPISGITHWQNWILPTIAQGMNAVALITRMTRSSMLEVIRQDYIRTARAKGLKERFVIRKHALKNALIPVITIIGMMVGMVMGGSVIVETIFSIPGIGMYMMSGITSRDYPIINGTVLLVALCVCVMNLIVDIGYAWIDPRIKAQYTSGKKRKKLKKAVEKAKEEGELTTC